MVDANIDVDVDVGVGVDADVIVDVDVDVGGLCACGWCLQAFVVWLCVLWLRQH